ncbi:50S ribosomal protein L6 [Candidatus Methylacidiphilum infernorum]|uniref:Large ribosomal subunit protein uL6 n=1 Tax=Methylacidiphilum infernorum (isolate V4) TaxID=481448 RepID=RL6_METI4|nr:50S ribosomal protein L6 [Candidatus Methylacidiphilum infernorum]B3E0J9.1 RecName: Full=Large ribosomal subunit protein uL6; AltName: Full=50S ribosomal protein L6 [Methylacidiphilum infernorum V4]ACD82753.1 Ribosomal protein L6P [Methylacidiphilum infernorum V4]
MSRIGKLPIKLPPGIKVSIEGNNVTLEGKKGKLFHRLPEFLKVHQQDGSLILENTADSRQSKAMYGLHRSLLNNAVMGVHEGFQKKLEINGIGFRAAVEGKKLVMNLGFSHPVVYEIPEGISVKVQDNTKLTIEGIDKCLVGAVAADIRGFYVPEPYKGKGIRYAGEVIRRKAGKTAQK